MHPVFPPSLCAASFFGVLDGSVLGATTLFLQNGYAGTSMDQVAAQATVSKQTVYKQFADKERLFTELILGITGRAAGLIEDMTAPRSRAPTIWKGT